MKLTIKSKNKKEDVTLNPEELLNILIPEVVESKKEDIAVLGNVLVSLLEDRHTIGDLTLVQLVTTSMSAGYFYRKLHEQNEIVIELQKTQLQ